MTEQELRGLVRQAIARHLGAPAGAVAGGTQLVPYRQHASHAVLTMVQAVEPGAPCVIEPAVPCNQCGYCKSLGH